MNATICFAISAAAYVLNPLPQTGPCACESNRRIDGWCPACKVGYLAGFRIDSAKLFEHVDAHGHDVNIETMRCPNCRDAHSRDGYCETCRIGFVRKKAFMSRLTYELARGERVDRMQLKCETCTRSTSNFGWCDACSRGLVGHVSIKDKTAYAHAADSMKRLLDAIALAKKCEGCAVASFSGGRCPACNVSYREGR